ncbi:MAG: LysR family transcriptional regulator [Comamonadaceae bacterium]|nr:MAG: LysR family transcriptional regulator [Comamonadaceae bacterium]
MRFKLRQMEIFRAVMAGGTVSEAARMLHVSQPAVSRSVAYTEQKLGLTLFQRSGGRLVPTAAAQRLLTEVDRVYQSALKVNELASELASTSKGSIRLLSTPCVSDNVFPRAISRFALGNPDVGIRYRTVMSTDIPIEILSNRCDVAVSALPVDHPGLQSWRLCTGRILCVVNRDHPLARQAAVSIEDLVATPYISYITDSPFGLAVAREFEMCGMAFQPAISIERSQDAWALAKVGGWPALVDEFITWSHEATPFVVLPLTVPITVDLWVVVSRHVPLSIQSREFIEALELETNAVLPSASVTGTGSLNPVPPVFGGASP